MSSYAKMYVIDFAPNMKILLRRLCKGEIYMSFTGILITKIRILNTGGIGLWCLTPLST